MSSFLRFSIEESVTFPTENVVGQLLSIELNPIISVEEFEQYISIRGSLSLHGEYEPSNERADEAELVDTRMVQSVEVREDGINELSHDFPVDITIPRNRVENLADIQVEIEFFDYEFPRVGELRLFADMTISGIYSTQQQSFSEETEIEEFTPFEVVARKSAEQASYFSDLLIEEDDTVVDMEDVPVLAMEEEREPELEQEYIVNLVKESLYQEFAREEVLSQATVPEVQVSQAVVPQVQISQATLPQVEQETKNENALNLSTIFAKNETSDVAKIKICIVQHGDSLGTIANRYDVSVSQLLRFNSLDHESDVEEGRLIYIPTLTKA